MKRYTYEFLIIAQAKQVELGDNYTIVPFANEYAVTPVDDTLDPFEAHWDTFVFTNCEMYLDKITGCSNSYTLAMKEIVDEFGELDQVFHTHRELVTSKFFETLKRIKNGNK